MATVTTIVCDRCGKKMDKKSLSYEYTLNTEASHPYLLSSIRAIDLCVDCKVELEDWLDGEDFSTGVTKNDD